MARLTLWIMVLAGLLMSASMSSCSGANGNRAPSSLVDTEQSVAKPVKDGVVDNLSPVDDASDEDDDASDEIVIAYRVVHNDYNDVPIAPPCDIMVEALTPEVTDGLDKRVIRKVLRSHGDKIWACYAEVFECGKNVGSGEVTVSWIIDEAGAVFDVTIEATTLQNKGVEDCLVETISRWRFPEPSNGFVNVEYPFVFNSQTDVKTDVKTGDILWRKIQTHRKMVEALTPEVTDGIDKRVIQKVVRSHFGKLRACYENEFERDKNVGSGKVAVSWIIDEAGAVSGVTIKETELQNKGVEDCLVETISRWRFPKPRGVDQVHVEYPFVFNSQTNVK